MSNKVHLWFLTLFYSGKSPIAPGTIGSLVALPLGLPIMYFSHNTLFLLTLIIAILAVKQIDLYESNGGQHDDKSIVIDELVGLWLALCLVPFDVWSIIGAFVLFRIFDIYKPSLIGVIDQKWQGGLGVVADDALAGILSGLCVGGVMKLAIVLHTAL
ncbi:phosphatidylglycerophosphatase A family protein [Helicobacter enhydrae]|uniref:phosphatidylglycerophosphatase A family protein n=1 Tax=Helicobacter enhydrae TaxID=222136 RepID=UPI001F2242F9|nr:phosphatidylglycerophosphatase A [Helicobacter enhydrae]